MSLAAQVASGPRRRHSACIIQRLRNSLPVDELVALDTMLDDPKRWPTFALERILRAEGHTVSDSSISAHRNNRCCCTGGTT